MNRHVLKDLSGVGSDPELTASPIDTKQRNSLTVRKLMVEANKSSGPSISNVYKQYLRSLINIFSSFSYINSEQDKVEVACIFGGQERAIAKKFEEQNIILPVLSIVQTTTIDDMKRGRYSSVIVQEKMFDEKKQRWIRLVSLPPKPITITYTLNIFSKYRSNLDQLLEQVRYAFNPVLEVPTNLSSVAKATITNEQDTGDADTGDKQDRVLKKALTLELETWVPSPKYMLTSTGEIEILVTEAEVSDT